MKMNPNFLPDQRAAYTTITDSANRQCGGIYCLDGPGETGKTFVSKLILAEVKYHGDIAVAIASSGFAATFLPGGRTAIRRLGYRLTCLDQKRLSVI